MSEMAPLSILVLDDEPEVRRLLSRALQRLGHRVRTASRVDEAIYMTKTELPDLVFADFQLGEDTETGMSLILDLKERAPDTFVALMSGHIISVTSPADLFVAKPLTFELVKSALDVFNRQKARTYRQNPG